MCFAIAGPSNEVIEYLRLALGVPIIVALTHPLVAGPISNTMYSDFQIFPNSGELSQVGAPSATMECKLVNANEEAIKDGTYRGDVGLIVTCLHQRLKADPHCHSWL